MAPQIVFLLNQAMIDDDIPSPGGSNSEPHQRHARPPRRILLVDDEPGIRLLSAAMLVRSGYYVDAAEDGAAGWEALQVKKYDLLITDHNMPKVTGVEMVKLLRVQDPVLPVILASGDVPTEELKRHPWLEISAILRKPYTVAQLLGMVRDVLLTARGTRQSTPRDWHGPSATGLQLS